MKRTKNRILSVFLSFCMIISCMAGINVTAGAEPNNEPVSYRDETGAEQTCTDYITVTEATGSFENGNWYVVNSDVTLTDDYGFFVYGDVNLILCDGAKLTVNGGIMCNYDGGFTIYAQSTGENMGKLIATYGGDAYGIGNPDYRSNRIITINGGDIQATGKNFSSASSNSIGIENPNNPVIINGGKVTASGLMQGIHAKSVTINGGEVIANSNGGNGIQATDVTINGGEVIASGTTGKAIQGTLTVADGLTVFGGDSADPTTVHTDYATTPWKYMTVKATPREPVTYLDETGTGQTCTDYIVFTEATTKLTDGNWYVVNSDVTLTDEYPFPVFGDVNLILCDGAKLTVNGGIECIEDGGFTVYAQSTGENMGKLIATYGENATVGIGNGGGNRIITINGGDIQATGSPTNTGAVNTGIFNLGNPVIINGGKVTASGYDYGIYDTNGVTINGGKVIASGNDYGIDAEDGAVTINGGEVTASGYKRGIFATDVTINGGEVIASGTADKAISGTLTVADGLTVFGDDSADPTTVRTNYVTTRWKYMTVKEIPLEPVSYLDETGAEQTCTDYIVVTEATAKFTDSNWYVVNSDVMLISDGFPVIGDVNLILCDGAKLTVKGGITCAREGGFTIYAQSTGANMGKLIAICGNIYDYGIGNTSNNRIITINGGDIQATGLDAWGGASSAAGIYNGGNPVIINGGKVTASGYDGGISATDVTINGGEVITSSTADKAIQGTLTVADGLTVFGGDSADPTTVRTNYAKDRWKYMTVKAAGFYSVTLTGGANATPDHAEGVSQTDLYGDMATVVYTANPGYYFEEFADITVNGITATRTDAQTVTVSGTPTDDVKLTVPDATAAFSSTVNVVWSETVVNIPEELTATLAGVDSYTLNAENSWSHTVTGLTQANNNWSIDCPVGYSVSSSTEGAETTFTFTDIRMPGPKSVTADSITLEEVTGYEYSKDNGETWQDSPTFTGLAPGTNYQFVQRPKGTTFKSKTNELGIVAFYVKFNVVNGKWDDGTDAEKTVVLARASDEDLALTLKSSDIPAVGSKPDNGYKAGSWDTVPTTEAVVSDDKTFTYTYAEKTTPTITAVPTASAITYGQTLANSNLTGGVASVDGTFAWKTPTTAPTVADSGTTEYDVTFTPNDTVNYTTAACKVKLTVGKAEPTITTAPTASAITYGQTLANSNLTGGVASVDGSFAWTTPTTAPAVADSGITEYDVTFTPNDTVNYTTAACKVKLTVGKAEPTITTAPTASAITYGQTLADSTLSGGAADVDGTFAWTTPTTAPAVADSDTTEYDVTFTPNDTDNYTTAAYKVTLTVNKADPTYKAPTANELTYTGNDLDLVTAGTVTGGRMVYSLDDQMFDDTIPTGNDAKEYTVYYMIEGDENHNDVNSSSINVTIAKADQDAPAVTAVAETIKGKADGKITGVNATMEYRADNENGYKPVTGTVITNLEPGIYHVRVMEDANHFVSPDTTVTVEEGRMLTVTFKTDSTTVYTTAECEYKGTVSAPAEDPEMEEHRFKYWQLDGEKFDFSTEITEDIELIARWEGLYDIKVIRGEADKAVAEAGEKVTIKADVFDNMYFYDWTSDAEVAFENSGEKTTTFTMPASDVEIAANFKPLGPDKPKPSGGSSGGTTPSHSSSSSDVSGSNTDQTAEKLRAVLNADNSLTVDWDKISGASKYILCYEKDGKEVQVTETAKTKITMKTAKNGFTYKFRLKYVTSGQTFDAPAGYTAELKVYYKPVLKLTQKNGKITASWKQVPGAEYYKVYKVVNGKLKFVTETTKTAVRFSGKSGKTYTYSVSAVVGGKETELTKSDRKSIKVK